MDYSSVILGMFGVAFAVAVLALLIKLVCKRSLTRSWRASDIRYRVHLAHTRPPTPSLRRSALAMRNLRDPFAQDNFLPIVPAEIQRR